MLTSIVRRYGGKDKKLAFDDFVVAITKVVINLGTKTWHLVSILVMIYWVFIYSYRRVQ